MRETSFIKQNQDKWADFEQALNGSTKDPEQLSDLFIQVTDDLSYSRTFYPNGSVRGYLNGLAQRIFFRVFKNRRSHRSRLFTFWQEELPLLMYHNRNMLLASFLIFAGCMLIGALSCAMDVYFARVILGDNYVDMTLQNIEKGDPMAVYKDEFMFSSWVGIAGNNLFVAFLTFVSGALFMVGTVGVLLRNGIMVGVFQYFFIERGLFQESFLTIWIHGTLEISAIVIAGAAGLILGKGLVFPNTFTRLQAFQISARQGIKIMIGIAPIIVLAAFFEAYLTRLTETPDIIRSFFILLCLIFVLGYYVWYPRRIFLQQKFKDLSARQLPPDSDRDFDQERIHAAGEIFALGTNIFRQHFRAIFPVAALFSLVFVVIAFFWSPVPPIDLFSFTPPVYYFFPFNHFYAASQIQQFFKNEHLPYMLLINWIGIGFLIYRLNHLLNDDIFPASQKSALWKRGWKKLLPAFSGSAAVCALFLLPGFLFSLVLLLVMPAVLLWAFVKDREHLSFFSGIKRVQFLLNGSLGLMLGLYLINMVIGVLVLAVLNTDLPHFFFEVINWLVKLEPEQSELITAALYTSISIFTILMLFSWWFIQAGILYFTLKEIREAGAIRRKLKTIGHQKIMKGLQWEE